MITDVNLIYVQNFSSIWWFWGIGACSSTIWCNAKMV